ncbi:2846_t:CDS:2 [Acaulospora morrowiae]|uniref:2846_t:CDS:1 n=1 Tax=Acaulospora morrowiae TaxID=94023 RepID=A0A9N9DUS6_9GLOM|nr:2846_t:CDS:2 [Acaulospora morrowiae]
MQIEKETSSESSAPPTPTLMQHSAKSLGKRKVTMQIEESTPESSARLTKLSAKSAKKKKSKHGKHVVGTGYKEVENHITDIPNEEFEEGPGLNIKIHNIFWKLRKIYRESNVYRLIHFCCKTSTIFTQPEFIEERKKIPNHVAKPMNRAFRRGERVSSRAYEILMGELPEEERTTSLSDEIIGARRAHELILTISELKNEQFTEDITITIAQQRDILQNKKLLSKQYNSTEIHIALLDTNINRALTGFDYRRYLCGLKEQNISLKK